MTPTVPNFLGPVLGQLPAWVLPLSMLGVALLLIFAGRTLVKLVAFVAVGLAGAAVGFELATRFIPAGGDLGLVLGFLVGGLVGASLVSLGIGLAAGYAGYLLALDLSLAATVALVVGAAFFIVGLALSGKILSVVTAVAGGLLLFDALSYYGLGPAPSTLLAAAATMLGLLVQLGLRLTQPAAARMGGQPTDHR